MRNIAISSNLNLSELTSYLQEKVFPQVLKWDEEDYFPAPVVNDLHRLGMMRSGLPVQYGGTALKMVDLLTIASELAYFSTGVLGTWLANLLGQTAISRFADEALAKNIFAEHHQNQSLMSFCATELECGIDIQRLQTVAVQTADGFCITGKKHYITNINHATHLIVLAKHCLPGQKPEAGLTAFYVPAKALGVQVGSPLKKLGQCESNTGQVEFVDVLIPEHHLLGRIGGGFDVLSTCISRTKTLLSGAAFGICRRAEFEAVDYLSRTVRYGEPLLARREIQAVLSGLRVKMEAAWLLACRSGSTWDEHGIAIYESNMAKLYAADTAVSFVNEALELTGAAGYMRSSILSKLSRDVKVYEIFEGATLVLQAMLGRELYAPVLKKRQLENAKEAA